MSSAIAALQDAIEDLRVRESALVDRTAEVERECTRMRDALRTEQDEARRQLLSERAELDRERLEFDAIAKATTRGLLSAKHKLTLNVGGVRYETTKSTLEASKYFESMLSGRHGEPETDDGCVFVDRDGALFAPILAFMRGARPRLGACGREELLEEAQFYLIDERGGHEPFREALDKRPSAYADSSSGGPDLSRAEIVKEICRRGGEPLFLRGASLCGLDLSRLDLTRAQLQKANLSGADLSGAVLSSANLADANLTNAFLAGANLMGTDLTNSTLTAANLSGVTFGRGDNGRLTDFSGARGVKSANFWNVDLSKVTGLS